MQKKNEWWIQVRSATFDIWTEQLLRASLLKVLFTIRSELVEQIEYHLLYR